MAGRFDGQVALVTGAARGQGRSHAVRFAEEGADIIAVDACITYEDRGYPGPEPEDLEETACLVEKAGRKAVAHRVDVRDLAALEAAVGDGVRRLGRLDVACVNAGIGTRYSVAHEMPPEEWQTMLDVNLTGAWHTCRASVPHILKGGRGGAVVLTGSVAGVRGLPHLANYTAAKHGVVGLMKVMAIELAPHLIRVNVVLPSQVDTPIIMNPKTFSLFCPDIDNPTKEDFAAASQASNLLPIPWADPTDISNAVLFLASSEARCVTGVALPVDNGLLVK